MKPNARLHHYYQNITKGNLKNIIEMYSLLDFKVVYTPPKNNTWVMIGQEQLRFAIQVAEVSDLPIQDIDIKRQTHIAFISENPKEVIEKNKNLGRQQRF